MYVWAIKLITWLNSSLWISICFIYQRKFTIICSLAGIISVFLPRVKFQAVQLRWVWMGSGVMEWWLSSRMVYRCCFLCQETSRKHWIKTRLITLVCGSIALLLILWMHSEVPTMIQHLVLWKLNMVSGSGCRLVASGAWICLREIEGYWF